MCVCMCIEKGTMENRRRYTLYLNTNFEIYTRNVNINGNKWNSRLSSNWPRLETLINISEIIFRHFYYTYINIPSTWCEIPFEIKLINENIKLCICIYNKSGVLIERIDELEKSYGSKFEIYRRRSENKSFVNGEYAHEEYFPGNISEWSREREKKKEEEKSI